MSYQILYGSDFIDMGNGKYLPITLDGSSNCTMYVGRKEILERYWHLFWNAQKDGICTKADMLSWAKSALNNHKADYEYEWFKKGGKWITGEGIYKFIENACKNAKTIEDYVKYCNQPIQLSLYGWNDKEDKSKRSEFYRVCHTTDEILKWFEEAKDYDMGEGYSKYYNAEFYGLKPFGIKKQSDKVFDKPFLVRVGHQYLVKYTAEDHKSYTTSKDKSQAAIYTDKEEFENLIIPTIRCISNKTVTAVSSEIKEEVNPYCIKIIDGNNYSKYIRRFNSKSIGLSYSIERSRKFKTEKEAQNKIDTDLIPFFPNSKFAVVNCLE